MLKKVLLSVCVVLGALQHYAQTPKSAWVDSVFNAMDQEEKIGQLFVLPVYTREKDYTEEIQDAIKSHHIGGVMLMDGGPFEVATFNNYVQSISKVPLLIGIDAERGLGKQLDSLIAFPPTLALGAIRDDTLLFKMGAEIGRQMKALGIHLNFAPNATLRQALKNDSLELSFGENKIKVAQKTLSYLKGMQSQGVLSCAKYFPVEGITVQDVRKDGLPVLNPYVDSVKIYPFEKLFDAGVTGILAASSDFPLFYEKKKTIKKNKYSTTVLSSVWAGRWLKKNMNFRGLVFASIPSILNQQRKYSRGDAELLAFQAGNEMILFPQDINPAVRKIKRLLRKESRYRVQLDSMVRKILSVKYDAGLSRRRPLNTDNLYTRLTTSEARILKQQLTQYGITVLNNHNELLPVKILEDRRIAVLSVGQENPEAFDKYISKYAGVTPFQIRSATDTTALWNILKNYNTIIIGVFPSSAKWQRSVLARLESMQSEFDIILCQFGSPLRLTDAEKFSTVIEAYSADLTVQQIVPQIIFGALEADGSLPVSVSSYFSEGQGLNTTALKRLSYSIPEDAGLDSRVLQKIERIALEAIEEKATPGCQVLVAKEGKIVYDRSFGWLTYGKEASVSDETIYDLASVTKVMATLQTVMFMHDRKLIDINKKASYYLPELVHSNKKDITLKEVLTHQAGLWPFLPFWAQTVKDSVFLPEFYSGTFNEKFPLLVADNLYAASTMRDSLWNWIIHAKMREKLPRTPFDYRYSDMGFYILHHLAEKILNQPMEDFLQQNLYEPLGAHTTGYLPLTRFPKGRIAPTEDDRNFRRRLLIGTVHDQGAAMHGGVAGHAGLFSNANDLAKIGQMLLQDGYYGGLWYFRPQTVWLFTRKQYELSRRGLGWDKPVQSDWNSPTSMLASPKTFGHTGFTGTCIWIDPEFDLVYIFLSNRVHPDMTNNKLIQANIRSRIQDVIYQSIFSYCASH